MAAESYSAYVAKAAATFFLREVQPLPEGAFVPRAETANNSAVFLALARLSAEDERVARSVYTGYCGSGFPYRVADAAKAYDLREKAVWKLTKRFERDIAQARGLI